MFLIDKLFFPKISLKLTIEPRTKIYDRITPYIDELNQMVLRDEKTMTTFKSYENSLRERFPYHRRGEKTLIRYQ